VYAETQDADLAWKVGLAACFFSGVIETAGAFCARWIKRHTPRAALLSGLAGVALSFMTLGFIFQIFARPAIALFPLLLILIVYGSRVRLPLGLPAGLVAVTLGTVVAWILRSYGLADFPLSDESLPFAFHFPKPAIAS